MHTAAGVACRQGCGAALRCRRRVVADLRRERRSCVALVGGRRCAPRGDCLGFATLAECRTEAGSFGRVRSDRCDRVRDRCRTCCDGATTCGGAALTVNDPDFLGSVGDAR
jgi:hypothetical protein